MKESLKSNYAHCQVLYSKNDFLCKMKEEELFNSIGESVENAAKGNLFGKQCFKINKKAFVCFFKNEMVFKLKGETHSDALSLDGAQLFDPSGKGRPMKEWVQLPFDYKDSWEEFAKAAAEYVDG